MKYRYRFSVIMACYNTAGYLKEAIDSLISQSIGFSHVQLIAVNDGSTDTTLEILQDYRERHLENIIVIDQPNGGLSAARNAGMKYIEGKYVNFLDGDDKMGKNTLASVWKFFETHRQETSVVSVPVYLFDRQKGTYYLNDKFAKGSRIVDLNKEWSIIEHRANSCFFTAEAIRKNGLFDTQLPINEDFQYLYRLYLHDAHVGLCDRGRYFYRKRSADNSSLLDSALQNPAWYINANERIYLYLMDLYRQKQGRVPRFLQYAIANDLSFKIRFQKFPYGVLDPDHQKQFLEQCRQIIQQFDPAIIARNPNIPLKLKAAMLRQQPGRFTITGKKDQFSVSFNDQRVCRLNRAVSVKLDFLNVRKDCCTLEGRCLSPFDQQPQLIVETGEGSYEAEINFFHSQRCLIEENMLKVYSFTVCFPLRETTRCHLLISLDDHLFSPTVIVCGQFMPLSDKLERMYSQQAGYLICRDDHDLLFQKNSLSAHLKMEWQYLRSLWKVNDSPQAKRSSRLASFLHPLIPLLRWLRRKPLWILRDRVNLADDNALALFRYIRSHHPETRAVFALMKQCPDFEKVARIGKTVDCLSRRYKLLYLLADYVISSAGEPEVFNPFWETGDYYKDLLGHTRFVFLQHGVTINDFSYWLNRYQKNAFGFIVSAQKEYEAMLHDGFAYRPEHVWLTGMPRFDLLEDEREKIITIMPTWRHYLVGERDRYGNFPDINRLKDSLYLKSWKALLNDHRFLDTARSQGYRIQLVTHPTLRQHVDILDLDESIILADGKSYNQIYRESALMITDYSSSMLDFAYLKKPVICYQFDQQEFFTYQYGHGYFSYENDGFGEVVTDHEKLIRLISSYLHEDCQMKPLYRKRVDEFFAFHDRSCCQRVYQKLLDHSPTDK